MWERLGRTVIKNRLLLLIILGVITVIMGFFASRVKLSYEFSKAIPTSNKHYKDYLNFKKVFGDDGNTLVIGVVSKDFFKIKNFEAYKNLSDSLKIIPGVESLMSIPGAITLKKNYETEKLYSEKIIEGTSTFGRLSNDKWEPSIMKNKIIKKSRSGRILAAISKLYGNNARQTPAIKAPISIEKPTDAKTDASPIPHASENRNRNSWDFAKNFVITGNNNLITINRMTVMATPFSNS